MKKIFLFIVLLSTVSLTACSTPKSTEKISNENAPSINLVAGPCKSLDESCQFFGQGVGGGQNCCAGTVCDGSGPDGMTGVCVERK